MSYNYTQLHQIIEMQYKNNNSSTDTNDRSWFFNESAKLFKGYTNPSKFLNTIISRNNNIIPDEELPPIYIDT